MKNFMLESVFELKIVVFVCFCHSPIPPFCTKRIMVPNFNLIPGSTRVTRGSIGSGPLGPPQRCSSILGLGSGNPWLGHPPLPRNGATYRRVYIGIQVMYPTTTYRGIPFPSLQLVDPQYADRCMYIYIYTLLKCVCMYIYIYKYILPLIHVF